MSHRADVLRGLTVVMPRDGTVQEDGSFIEEVDLCPEAQVFSWTICGGFTGEGPAPDPPELVAVLKLQDSQIELWSNCCSVRADLPAGVRWPGSARFIVAPDAFATLTLSYGQCGAR